MNRPTISVLMPVYNCAPYLDEAILSVRGQTFPDFEFIIVNDGSTDESLGIIERHAAVDARIALIDRPNGGIVSALNAGLSACRGDYIARMDGDDISVHDRFEIQLKHLSKNESVGVVGGQIREFTDRVQSAGETSTFPLDHLAIVERTLRKSIGMQHPAWMVRAEMFRKCGNYDPKFCDCEDVDMLLRFSLETRLANISECVLFYRRHKGAVSLRLKGEQARTRLAVVLAAMNRSGVTDRGTLASAAYRASWTTRQDGIYLEAARLGFLCWWWAPLSARGPRAVAASVRCAVFGHQEAAADG